MVDNSFRIRFGFGLCFLNKSQRNNFFDIVIQFTDMNVDIMTLGIITLIVPVKRRCVTARILFSHGEEEYAHYDNLCNCEIVKSIFQTGKLIILGDFNAQVELNHGPWSDYFGKYDFGKNYSTRAE